MLELNFQDLLSETPIVLLVLIVTLLIWEYLSIPKNFPPGPWGLPYIGYLPFVGKKPHITLAQLGRKYGDVFTLRAMHSNSLVLCSYKALNEAFVQNADACSFRPSEILPFQENSQAGVIFNNGESWSANRRFTLSTLRNFGFGKSSLQQKIMEEAQSLIDVIKTNEGRPLLFADLLQKAITNVICTLISGHRLDYNDPVVNELLHLAREITTQFGLGKLETALPIPLQKMNILKILGIKTLSGPLKRVREIMTKSVDTYSKRHRPGGQENFVDCYLTEIEKKGTDPALLTINDLPYLLRDLFVAGSDTTTNSLTWGFLYMAKYQEVQKKVQHEIDEVIGRDRSPDLADQKNLPYTDATIMEFTRIMTIAPLSIPRCTSKDMTLNGYFIPKNTFIVPNLHAIHHDPQTFPEPDKFKPERFINDQNQAKRIEQLIPFSIGKRQCLGESLARMELFLFFTAILQQFTVKGVEGVPLDFDYDYAGVSIPKSQNLCFIPR